jgi:predicted regulator of Ras-like GTPase activity (Roadblock/LC7/MglB family)
MITDILYEAVDEVNGAQFAAVIGTDGLHVEIVAADEDLPVDLEDIEAELVTMTTALSKTSNRLGSGYIKDLVVESEELTFLASQVIPGYFAFLGVTADGNLGRARFAVHRMTYRLQSEL